MNAYTPIITGLNNQGTTFYTFASAARDLSKCLGNSEKQFRFSKFVCLNLPDIINDFPADRPDPGTVETSNSLHFQRIEGLEQLQQLGKLPPMTSAETIRTLFEDYVLNFEQLLMKEYSATLNTSDYTFAERVWWNFLVNTGTIEPIVGASWDILNPSYAGKGEWYIERSCMDTDPDYPNGEPVVTYIGDIDITNNIDIAGESYTELYCYIPSEHGNTPGVLFRKETSVIGNATHIINGDSDNEYTFGHAADQIYALYDGHTAEYTFKSNPMVLELDPMAYREIALTQNVHNFAEFNKTGSNFEFNCILVYYDINDTSTGDVARNLYGVLFLDSPTSGASCDYIQRFPKYKAMGAGSQNGNAFGIKLDLRIDTAPDKPAASASFVNEYNTFSMGVFAEASAKINEILDNTLSAIAGIDTLSDRVGELENIAGYIADYQNMAMQVKSIEEALENAGVAFADRSVITNRLIALTEAVNELRRSTSLNDIVGGYGISVRKETAKTFIDNTLTGYSIVKAYLGDGTEITPQSPIDLSDTSLSVTCELSQGTCYCVVYADKQTALNHVLEIHLNNTATKFLTGQRMKFRIAGVDAAALAGYGIRLYVKGFQYQVDADAMNTHAPAFEVVCLDSNANDDGAFIIEY